MQKLALQPPTPLPGTPPLHARKHHIQPEHLHIRRDLQRGARDVEARRQAEDVVAPERGQRGGFLEDGLAGAQEGEGDAGAELAAERGQGGAGVDWEGGVPLGGGDGGDGVGC